MNILYIHGLGGNKEGSNGKLIKQTFEQQRQHHVFLETFNLLKPQETFPQIEELLKTFHIHWIMATSLGAFYTLVIPGKYGKILTNPCMLPSVEIPKLIEVSPQSVHKFKQLENHIYSDRNNKQARNILAAFADHDELFSYQDYFNQQYPKSTSITFKGSHHLNPAAIQEIKDPINKFLTQTPHTTQTPKL